MRENVYTVIEPMRINIEGIQTPQAQLVTMDHHEPYENVRYHEENPYLSSVRADDSTKGDVE
jgi:hypothetical protein